MVVVIMVLGYTSVKYYNKAHALEEYIKASGLTESVSMDTLTPEGNPAVKTITPAGEVFVQDK